MVVVEGPGEILIHMPLYLMNDASILLLRVFFSK